jgi:hypothetical protein
MNIIINNKYFFRTTFPRESQNARDAEIKTRMPDNSK